jgi:hypothetical protein
MSAWSGTHAGQVLLGAAQKWSTTLSSSASYSAPRRMVVSPHHLAIGAPTADAAPTGVDWENAGETCCRWTGLVDEAG